MYETMRPFTAYTPFYTPGGTPESDDEESTAVNPSTSGAASRIGQPRRTETEDLQVLRTVREQAKLVKRRKAERKAERQDRLMEVEDRLRNQGAGQWSRDPLRKMLNGTWGRCGTLNPSATAILEARLSQLPRQEAGNMAWIGQALQELRSIAPEADRISRLADGGMLAITASLNRSRGKANELRKELNQELRANRELRRAEAVRNGTPLWMTILGGMVICILLIGRARAAPESADGNENVNFTNWNRWKGTNQNHTHSGITSDLQEDIPWTNNWDRWQGMSDVKKTEKREALTDKEAQEQYEARLFKQGTAEDSYLWRLRGTVEPPYNRFQTYLMTRNMTMVFADCPVRSLGADGKDRKPATFLAACMKVVKLEKHEVEGWKHTYDVFHTCVERHTTIRHNINTHTFASRVYTNWEAELQTFWVCQGEEPVEMTQYELKATQMEKGTITRKGATQTDDTIVRELRKQGSSYNNMVQVNWEAGQDGAQWDKTEMEFQFGNSEIISTYHFKARMFDKFGREEVSLRQVDSRAMPMLLPCDPRWELGACIRVEHRRDLPEVEGNTTTDFHYMCHGDEEGRQRTMLKWTSIQSRWSPFNPYTWNCRGFSEQIMKIEDINRMQRQALRTEYVPTQHTEKTIVELIGKWDDIWDREQRDRETQTIQTGRAKDEGPVYGFQASQQGMDMRHMIGTESQAMAILRCPNNTLPWKLGASIWVKRGLNMVPLDGCPYEYWVRYECYDGYRGAQGSRQKNNEAQRQLRVSSRYLLPWEYTTFIVNQTAREMVPWEKDLFFDTEFTYKWQTRWSCNKESSDPFSPDPMDLGDDEDEDGFDTCKWCPLGDPNDNPYAPTWCKDCSTYKPWQKSTEAEWIAHVYASGVSDLDKETAPLPLDYQPGGAAAADRLMSLAGLYEEANKATTRRRRSVKRSIEADYDQSGPELQVEGWMKEFIEAPVPVGGLRWPHTAFHAFDCSVPLDLKAMTTETGMCKEEVATTTVERPYYIIQKAVVDRRSGQLCRGRKWTFPLQCGDWSHATILTPFISYDINWPIPEAVCREAWRTGVITDTRGTPKKINLNGTTVLNYDEVGETLYKYETPMTDLGCKGGRFRGCDTYGCIDYDHMVVKVQLNLYFTTVPLVTDEEKAEMRDDDTQIIIRCPPGAGACVTSEGTYLWVPKSSNELLDCPYYMTRHVKGLETEHGEGRTVFITTDNSLIRLEIKREESIIGCGVRLFPTDYPRLYVTNDVKGSRLDNPLPSGEGSLALDYTQQDKYLFTDLLHTLNAALQKERFAICEASRQRRKTSYATLAAEQAAVTDGVTLGLGGPWFATAAGSAWWRYRCRRLAVFGEQQDRCYNALPIKLGRPDAERYWNARVATQQEMFDKVNSTEGRQLFLEPKTHRVIEEAETMPCSDVFPPLYVNWAGKWVKLGPLLTLADYEPEPALRQGETERGISQAIIDAKIDQITEDGGVYPQEMTLRMEAFRRAPRKKAAIMTELSNQMHGPEYASGGRTYGGQPFRANNFFAELPSFDIWGPMLSWMQRWGGLLGGLVGLWFIGQGILSSIGCMFRTAALPLEFTLRDKLFHTLVPGSSGVARATGRAAWKKKRPTEYAEHQLELMPLRRHEEERERPTPPPRAPSPARATVRRAITHAAAVEPPYVEAEVPPCQLHVMPPRQGQRQSREGITRPMTDPPRRKQMTFGDKSKPISTRDVLDFSEHLDPLTLYPEFKENADLHILAYIAKSREAEKAAAEITGEALPRYLPDEEDQSPSPPPMPDSMPLQELSRLEDYLTVLDRAALPNAPFREEDEEERTLDSAGKK